MLVLLTAFSLQSAKTQSGDHFTVPKSPQIAAFLPHKNAVFVASRTLKDLHGVKSIHFFGRIVLCDLANVQPYLTPVLFLRKDDGKRPIKKPVLFSFSGLSPPKVA